jgi:hypothetical protein
LKWRVKDVNGSLHLFLYFQFDNETRPLFSAWTVALLHHLLQVLLTFAHAKNCASDFWHNVVKIPYLAVADSLSTTACIIWIQIIQLTVVKNYDRSDN